MKTSCYQLIFCINVAAAWRSNIDFEITTVPERITKRGYPLETYENIKTEDGYLLTIFRIPNGKNRTAGTTNKKPVLLIHGLGGSSREYVLLDSERSLGYWLADRGYDVWLANARGTLYSRKHVVLNADTSQDYWNFSWHEIGVYDLAATIDLIKNVTKDKKISCVGISQGNTIFYALASEKPTYNADISLMVSLGPTAFMEHLLSPLPLALSKYESFLYMLSRLIGLSEIPPRSIAQVLGLVARALCQEDSVFIDICADLFLLTGGYNPSQFNKSTIATIYGDGPSPVSIRQLLHYAQIINTGKFRQYNFGEAINLKIYGAPNPPTYNLSRITAPVSLFYSRGDWFAQPEDVKKLCNGLANCVHKYKVPMRRFSHYDFLSSIDVVSLVFQKLLWVLEEYTL